MSRNIVFLMLAFVALFYFLYDERKSSNNEATYFDTLDLILEGRVESVDRPSDFNRFGIVKVSIIKSNISFYDPTKDLDYYYCIIKNNQAEFYQIDLYECEPGDIVKVNTRKRQFFILKKDTVIEEDIRLYTNEYFYKYVRKKHQRFE